MPWSYQASVPSHHSLPKTNFWSQYFFSGISLPLFIFNYFLIIRLLPICFVDIQIKLNNLVLTIEKKQVARKVFHKGLNESVFEQHKLFIPEKFWKLKESLQDTRERVKRFLQDTCNYETFAKFLLSCPREGNMPLLQIPKLAVNYICNKPLLL